MTGISLGEGMDQDRPYKSASVKNLEQTFKDYRFNRKVLSAMRAELSLRSTKSARALLDVVDGQLAEITRRDNFPGVLPEPALKKTVQKVSAPAAPPKFQPRIPTVA